MLTWRTSIKLKTENVHIRTEDDLVFSSETHSQTVSQTHSTAKIYAATEKSLTGLFRIIKTFISSHIIMEFGMNKSKVLHINKSQWKKQPKQRYSRQNGR